MLSIRIASWFDSLTQSSWPNMESICHIRNKHIPLTSQTFRNKIPKYCPDMLFSCNHFQGSPILHIISPKISSPCLTHTETFGYLHLLLICMYLYVGRALCSQLVSRTSYKANRSCNYRKTKYQSDRLKLHSPSGSSLSSNQVT